MHKALRWATINSSSRPHLLAAFAWPGRWRHQSLLQRAGESPVRSAPPAETIERLPKVEGTAARCRSGEIPNPSTSPTRKRKNAATGSSPARCSARAEDKGEAGRLLREHGLNRRDLEAAIEAVRRCQAWAGMGRPRRVGAQKYTLDLTRRARMGKLDPVIGRDDEIRRAIQILQRRTKNNPVLIGEPGVRQDRHRGRIGAAHRQRGSAGNPPKGKRVLC